MEGEKTMSSKAKILSTLRYNTRRLNEIMEKEEINSGGELFEMPDFSSLKPIVFEDPVSQFIEKARTSSGAKVVEVANGEDINSIIHEVYPEAKIIASNLKNIDSILNPDTVEDVRELMKTDVGVVEGKIGVAENGCVWIPQNMKEKAVCFASENLVILLHKEDIVSNMHEAYKKISDTPEYFEPYKFGTFISGPSKTADIESALVYGAQAARSVTVLLI